MKTKEILKIIQQIALVATLQECRLEHTLVT
jgi:hypothetical protein